MSSMLCPLDGQVRIEVCDIDTVGHWLGDAVVQIIQRFVHGDYQSSRLAC